MYGGEDKNMAMSMEEKLGTSSLPRHVDYLWGRRWAVQQSAGSQASTSVGAVCSTAEDCWQHRDRTGAPPHLLACGRAREDVT